MPKSTLTRARTDADRPETPGDRTKARTVRARRSLRNRRVRRSMVVVLASMALLLAGVAAWGFVQLNSLERVGVDLTSAEDLAPRNVLLVGSDTRDLDGPKGYDSAGIFGNKSERAPTGERADTIMIARVDPDRATIETLSIPRDLWVDDDGAEGRRINSAYSDGAQSLVDAIESNLGIPIHNYIEVDFNGFKGLVDAVGGVPLYFDRPVRDRNTGLNVERKGCYVLDGTQALAFARARHLVSSNGVRWVPDETGDLGRITRQQVFLRHALAEVTALGLGDIDSLRVLTGVAVNNVKIDDSMSTREMFGLTKRFKDFDASTMVVHRLETEPFRTEGGSSVLRLSRSGSQAVIDIFTGRAEPSGVSAAAITVKPDDVVVDVLNGSTSDGLAARTSESLVAMGFVAGAVESAPPTDDTVVTYPEGAEAAAMLVASRISPTPQLVIDRASTVEEGHVAVTLGGPVKVAERADDGKLPGAPADDDTSGTSAGGVIDTSATGEGTATPEEPVGLTIGDPPPGVECRRS